MKINTGRLSVDFSIPSIKKRYRDSEKEKLLQDMIGFANLEEKEVKKIVERVWKEAYPVSGKITEEGLE